MFCQRPHDRETRDERGENGCLNIWGKTGDLVQECDEDWCQWSAVQQGGQPYLDSPRTFDVVTAYDGGKKLPMIHTRNRVGQTNESHLVGGEMKRILV